MLSRRKSEAVRGSVGMRRSIVAFGRLFSAGVVVAFGRLAFGSVAERGTGGFRRPKEGISSGAVGIVSEPLLACLRVRVLGLNIDTAHSEKPHS